MEIAFIKCGIMHIETNLDSKKRMPIKYDDQNIQTANKHIYLEIEFNYKLYMNEMPKYRTESGSKTP